MILSGFGPLFLWISQSCRTPVVPPPELPPPEGRAAPCLMFKCATFFPALHCCFPIAWWSLAAVVVNLEGWNEAVG